MNKELKELMNYEEADISVNSKVKQRNTDAFIEIENDNVRVIVYKSNIEIIIDYDKDMLVDYDQEFIDYIWQIVKERMENKNEKDI